MNPRLTLSALLICLGPCISTADFDPMVIYSQDFDSFADGTQDLGDGTVITGGAEVIGGQLQLTRMEPGINSAYWIPPNALSQNGWVAEFDYSIASFGFGPADGFSFCYGNIPPGVTSQFGEEGFPGLTPVLSFEIDTWMVGDLEVGPAIAVNDTNISGGSINGPILVENSAIEGSIRISAETDGTVSFVSTGAITNAQFENLDSNFDLDASFAFAFAARTGGATQDVFIDNLRVFVEQDPVDTIGELRVASVEGEIVSFEIPTSRGRDIGIEFSPDLSPGSWIELGNLTQHEDCISRFSDTDPGRTTGGRGFYRAFLRPLSR